MKQDKITIHGPKIDGTYIVEFKTADGVALAFSVPKGERDCRPGVLPRQDALRARGAGRVHGSDEQIFGADLTQSQADGTRASPQTKISVTLEPITSEQATNGQRLLLIPGRASK